MSGLIKSRNYIIINSYKELEEAKACDLCRFIILEDKNAIYIWKRFNGIWNKEKYVEFGGSTEKDETVTGLRAYQSFYSYCGKEAVDKMKHILKPINIWDSYEQMHYCNIDYAGKKIYQPIYCFDANSAFTYGTLQLPKGFEPLKEYMLELYEKKKLSTNKITRSKYKNLQNFLIGYFTRIKDFIAVRSEIIKQSNINIDKRIIEILNHKGKVYLSNTDSIVTDTIGAEIMNKYLGDEAGQFKLEMATDKLCYKSPNAYQIGNKIVYSGVSYFARQHTDFFKDIKATQFGSLINGYDYSINFSDEQYIKICRIKAGEIIVITSNLLGEELKRIKYRIEV